MTFPAEHMGELFSVLCAMLWAVAVILFRKSGEHVPPMALNFFKNTVAAVLFPLTMVLLGAPMRPATAELSDWLVLLASGAIGIGAADTFLFASLNRIGAGRSAIVESGYSPAVVLCSVVYLHEPFTASLLLALVLMVGAVLITARGGGDGVEAKEQGEAAEESARRAELGRGVLYGVVALLLMAVGIVLAKPVLDRSDALWVSTVRLAGGLAVLSVQALSPRHRADIVRCFLPSRAWRVTLPAAFVGSYLAVLFWILGMKYTSTTTASVLNQLSALFVLLLAALFLREPLTRRKMIALSLGLAGAIVAVA